ncbi:virulence factor TspB C-terminal domain-related protein [Moraxella sp. Pampa]|uniref:virulence factor TspB C-terminal domain-related protein n=1 Tax=Moraxella sp. Pampa TaxID=3111978 RepID=UPI002B402998|nr:virulence factor TspB C-terminal domain-related protein [Moraxella sp. Pampa]
MKKILLCLLLLLTSVSAHAGAQRDDEGLFNQSSIDQQKEIKKLEKHADKLSPLNKNHVGHSSPSGWTISKNPQINKDGDVTVVAKKEGKVSTVTVDKDKIKQKIGLSHKIRAKRGNAFSLFSQMAIDIAKDMYGQIDNLAIIGDVDASWFDKFYNFIFNKTSNENLEKLKLQFDLPPHGYYWVLSVHDSFLDIDDSPFVAYHDLVIPSVSYTQQLCDTDIVTSHIGGKNYRAYHKLIDDAYSLYGIFCVPQSHVGLYSPYSHDYSIYMSMYRSVENKIQVKDFIEKIPDAAKLGTSNSAKNIVESMAVVDVLSGDYDQEFTKNQRVDSQPLEIPNPEPYIPYYPVGPDTATDPARDPKTDPARDPKTDPARDPKTDPARDPKTDQQNPSTTIVNRQFPVFCTWAKPVCDFITWFKKEPDDNDFSDRDRPKIDDLSFDMNPSDFDSDYLKYGGQCPDLDSFVIPIGEQSINMKFDISPFCSFVVNVRPAILAIAYLLAMMIIGRAIQQT